jgi:aminoglycoside phosphotransferase (APT) family kinase protein
VADKMHDNEVDIDEGLVRRLIESQMPQLANLPLSRVEPWGTDNGIYRLRDDLVVRLPRIASAEGQVNFEATWLPRLGPQLPVEVPEPVAIGEPGDTYPFSWAVHKWLPGEGASIATINDPVAFALDLAEFVKSLQRIPTDAAPTARNRARPLRDYDLPTRQAIERARHLIDADAALAVWEAALAAAPHNGPTRWVHADLEGNCLVRDGRLSGIVDWGSACAGDPAVDIQVIWSPLFTEPSRSVFLEALEVDDATIARSRGAAINQTCAALPYYLTTYPLIVERSWHKLAALGVPAARGTVQP